MTRRKQKTKRAKRIIFREDRIQKLLDRGWIKSASEIPLDAIPVDPDAVKYRWDYYGPMFFRDMPFVCRDCGSQEVWKADDQQWYYEVVKGPADRTAVRCLACRRAETVRKAEARKRAGHDPK